MHHRLLATVSVGLLSAACQQSYQTGNVSAATGSGIYESSNQACVDYGFVPNTSAYSRCVTTEQQARLNYRPTPGYAPSLVVTDSRNACSSYGLTVGTASYDRCVARETQVRTYRDSAAVPAYRVDAEGYRVDAQGYRVDANGYRLQTSAPVPAYRTDPYGYRVDAEGYRVDANGYRLAGQPAPAYYPPPPTYPPASGYYDAQGNRISASGRY